jgi:acetyl esterase/lipase
MISLKKLEFFLDTYAGGHDKKDPRISPLFADLSGLPPTLFHASKSELLYSDSLIAHQKISESGGNSELFAPDNMWHVWHLMSRYVPESREAVQQVAGFIRANS